MNLKSIGLKSIGLKSTELNTLVSGDTMRGLVATIYIDSTVYNVRQSWGLQDWGTGVSALSEDIARNGLLNPIVITPKVPTNLLEGESDEVFYDLVCGHRRFEAMTTSLGHSVVPCTIRTRPTEDIIWDWITAENEQRQDLSHSERALLEAQCKAIYIASGTCSARANDNTIVNPGQPTFSEVRALRLGISEKSVENYVRLGQATPEVREALDDKVLQVKGAYSLSRLCTVSQIAIVGIMRTRGLTYADAQEVHMVAAGFQDAEILTEDGPVPFTPSPIRVSQADHLRRVESELEGALTVLRYYAEDVEDAEHQVAAEFLRVLAEKRSLWYNEEGQPTT